MLIACVCVYRGIFPIVVDLRLLSGGRLSVVALTSLRRLSHDPVVKGKDGMVFQGSRVFAHVSRKKRIEEGDRRRRRKAREKCTKWNQVGRD